MAFGTVPDAVLPKLIGMGAFAGAEEAGAVAWDFIGAVLEGMEVEVGAAPAGGREGTAILAAWTCTLSAKSFCL